MKYTWIDVWAKWWIVTINHKLEVEYMLNIPKHKWEVDWKTLAQFIYTIDNPVAIEDVKSIFWMSAKSNFNFWYIKWFKMACLVNKDVTLVQPKTWQKVAWNSEDIVRDESWKKRRKDTKETSLNASQRIFPWVEWRTWKQRVDQDWLYDSALIAYWLLKTYWWEEWIPVK